MIELAAALGVSTLSGANQVAVTLKLRYRLPRLWARVVSGACPVWKARQVAEKTMGLCEDGAAEVDGLGADFRPRHLVRPAVQVGRRGPPAVGPLSSRREAQGRGRRAALRHPPR